MTITFTQVPTSVRVPGSYIEINASQASVDVGANQKIMVIGQRKSAGTVDALTPTLISSYSQAVNAFGAGSMLAAMFKVLYDNNSTTEKWAIALDDVSGGTAATGSVTTTATSAQAGTVSLYIGGVLVPVAVASGATSAQIATSIAAGINANNELPVTAAVDGTDTTKVNLTFDHKGTVGNSVDVRVNYANETLPTGVTVDIVAFSGGATDPDIATAFAIMPSQIFNYIIIPYNDSANLNACDTEMNNRWSATRMLDGHIFTAASGTVSTVGTLGSGRNSQHMTLSDAGNGSPTPNYLWTAAVGGQVAAQASVDPALPFRGLVLNDVLAGIQANRRTKSERETLLHDGIATNFIGDDGRAYIERLTTTYQLSSVSLPDTTYLDATTVFTLSRLKQELNALMGSRFARFKLADDGAATVAGSNVITPSGIKAEIVALAQQWSAKGWIENIATFISSIVVERDQSDPTRVNVIIAPNLVNPLQIIAVSVQFTL